MALGTVYDVRVRYDVDNKAGRNATKGLKDDVKGLNSEVNRSSMLFGRLGAAIGAAFGVRAGTKALIGFNATAEDTKNQIASMLALVKDTSVGDELARADRLYGNLQKRAATLPGTTQEYVEMAGKLARVITSAGGGVKDIEDLTVSAVVAAKGLGEQWDVAARDIEQALMGRYNTTDPFLSKILPMIGYGGEEGRDKWRNLSADKRFTEMQRALSKKQIQESAQLQSQSFNGLLDTVKNNLQILFGGVGAQLFARLKIELRDINAWMEANSTRLGEIAKSVGDGLVTGFSVVKSAVMLLVEHADLLITAGKLWAAAKAGSVVMGAGSLLGIGAAGVTGGGLLARLAAARAWGKGQSDSFDKDGYQFDKGGRGRQRAFSGGIGGVLGALGMAASAGAVGYAIGDALGLGEVGSAWGKKMAVLTGRTDAATLAFEKLNRQSDALSASIAREREVRDGPSALTNLRGANRDALQRANLVRDTHAAWQVANANNGDLAAKAAYLAKKEAMEAAGISSADVAKAGGAAAFINTEHARAGKMGDKAATAEALGLTYMGAALAQMTDYQRRSLDSQQAQEQVMKYVVASMSWGNKISGDVILDYMKRNTADYEGKHTATADKPKVNVTIQRIEVQSEDPDRMAFGLIEAFRDAAKNPSSALSALREG